MEQTMKTCPYCGEEIMATAKKCKHCGEWLVESFNVTSRQQSVRRESYFGSKYLYDKVWMNVLFWVTIVGAFIQAVHQSGLSVSESTSSYLKFIRYAGEIPEAVGDFLCAVGEICFITLLMKVFSNFHKPLKGWFVTYIVFAVIFLLISLLSGESQDETVSLSEAVSGLAIIIPILIPIILLPIMIVSNYEGNIKTLGWVMIGYTIASITAGLVADYIVPIAAFLIIFLVDFFYYRYLRDTLTKN